MRLVCIDGWVAAGPAKSRFFFQAVYPTSARADFTFFKEAAGEPPAAVMGVVMGAARGRAESSSVIFSAAEYNVAQVSIW